MRVLALLLAFGITLPAATPADAMAIRPSFWAASLAWSATHVVVATEGEKIDGHLTVLRSLAGDLRPGARLELPALAAFAPRPARTIWRWASKQPEKAPILDGRRLLLFLRRTEDGWKAASTNGDWSISLAWLERDGPYARRQPINPGPVVTLSLHPTEAELLRETLQVLGDRSAFTASVALADVKLRVTALRSGALGAADSTRVRFLDGLATRCGEEGKHALARMLTDDKLLAIHPLLVSVLERHDAERLRRLLPGLLERDLAFWREDSPGGRDLNRTAPPRGSPALHYRRTHAVLRNLAEHRYPEAMPAGRAMLAYWAEQRALDEWLRYTVGCTIQSVAKRFESR